MSQLIPSTTPLRVFQNHTANIWAVAVFPNRQRMVTASHDKTLLLWDLKTGIVLKKMEGHRVGVDGLVVSRDGQMIASGDDDGMLIAWHRETGESLTQAIKAHSNIIWALDFSPDGTVLATGSDDETTKLWSTKTWQIQGNPIKCSAMVLCVWYLPSGELLAVATSSNIEIYNPGTSQRISTVKGHTGDNLSLVWTPDGTRLLSAGDDNDPNIREWNTSTWKQVGDPWTGHTDCILAIAIHPAGTHLTSASTDKHVRLWRLSDRQTIAIFKHSNGPSCVTFSMDGKHILSGGQDKVISEWEAPKDTWSEEALALKILAITMTVHKACITGDLAVAEKILMQEINTDANNNTSYANRSLIMARKLDWDRALQDAIKSLSIRPSLTGYLAKGVALCRKQQVSDATTAFNLAFNLAFAFMFTADGYSKKTHFLFLIKAIALFNENHHKEAMQPIQEPVTRPNPNPLASRVVELGIIATDGALHKEAADHFTAAMNTGTFFATLDIHSMYEDFVMLFGWNLKSLWQIANQQCYHALFRAGQFGEALEAY
ncbi:WD40-repeat-containing domain protein [Suillus paluster]|uniref:WD40-repeat-containing domain protein n=1 Tax=Suillus paluster TaxID=48578 RepID=UPI001B87E6C9|nr:WD40-repeat-containing domain protein [Suillus paluster]KAG1731856.1 WD40-repeat-containing domain protein [Suillus paluster]